MAESKQKRIAKLTKGKSPETVEKIFQDAKRFADDQERKRRVSKYVDEYRSYLRDCLDDPDFDLTTLEDFDTWAEEEEQENKIRCKKCGSLNTEQRGTEKYCTDCNQVEMITANNQANWVGKAANKQQSKIRFTEQGRSYVCTGKVS